jgi:hypothetical protein
MLTNQIPVTFDRLRTVSQEDELLETVKRFIKTSWPDRKTLRQQPNVFQIEGFYRRREALSIEEEYIMFRERFVIPTALRTRVLKLLHQEILAFNG